jgi:hypothetical protein
MIDFTRPGRMISGSKTAPKGHFCVFNANVCTKSRGKIWFGDLDITDDAADLQRLAETMGEDIYVLREVDGRFRNETNPLLHKAVARITPDGIIDIGG